MTWQVCPMYCMLINLLTTNVYVSFCLKVIRPWLNLLTGGHGHVICMVIYGGGVLEKILQKAAQIRTNMHIFHINKEAGEMVIMNDLE